MEIELIQQADFLLIAAGAGFSADSGLPVYNDIADVAAYQEMGLDYQDLCDPDWLYDDDEIFYGFWGDCFDKYRETQPHIGYEILKKWKKMKSNAMENENIIGDMYVELEKCGKIDKINDESSLTNSPVDAHFQRVFNSNEIYEIHGNIETWQCGGKHRKSPPCSNMKWQAPAHFNFSIDKSTMKFLTDTAPDFMACSKCKEKARPNILMFRDANWIQNTEREDSYVKWEAVIEKILTSDNSKKLVILEIGCGTRVPSVRLECEMVLRDILNESNSASPQVNLIRINPDISEVEFNEASLGVHLLKDTGLKALIQIDELLNS